MTGSLPEPALGRPLRRFEAAVSAEAMALAWAHSEDPPTGAAVVVEREVVPSGRGGELWDRPAETTLAFAVILRPELPAEEGDLVWLMVSLAAAEAASTVTGRAWSTWWPDAVVDQSTGARAAAVKGQVQLGPGRVRSAVGTVRFDVAALGLDAEDGDALLAATLPAMGDVASAGAEHVIPRYERRCFLLGRRVRARLRPRGEARGVAQAVDRRGRLELVSATGMVERVSVDALRDLDVVER